MKSFFASAALAAAVLAGSVAASSAAPIPLVLNATVVPQDGSQYNSPKETAPFVDYYGFQLLQSYDVSASFSGQFSLIKKNLANLADLTFGIFKGSFGSGTEVLTGSISKQGAVLTGGTDDAVLTAGSYYIQVSDTLKGATGTYNGTLSLSAVPLPTSVALFGAALAALGVAGVARRKSIKASATA